MIVAWRLAKERRAAGAFAGEGARLHGGRWNHAGFPVVYVAQSLSLAVLEQFVQLGPEGARLRFVYFRLELPDEVRVEALNPDAMPPNWREEPAPDSTKDLGTHWAESNRSAVLRVPSVIVPIEHNYLLSPRHPGFRLMRISGPEPFSLDPRMWKQGQTA